MSTPEEHKERIELRSYQLREILGQVPAWIIRFGTLVISAVLIVVIVGSAVLKYPDITTAPIILTTETPPAELNAKISAKIEKLFIKDKDTVAEGQVLMLFESAARYDDIIELDQLLGTNFNPDTLVNQYFPDNLSLGPVQESYAVLQKRIGEYQSFIRLDYYKRKLNSVNVELDKHTIFMNRLEEQEEVMKKDYDLANKQYKRDSALQAEQVIASSQLDKSEALLLNSLSAWKDIRTKLASAQIEASNLHQEILELELNLEENSRHHTQQIREAFEMLNGQISLWKEQYLLFSPFKGQVSLTKIWSENQYVEKGDVVITILPFRQGQILGKAYFSTQGAGKVKEGHKVVMRFNNYPYMEFGTVTGRITSISLVPTNNSYTAEVRLDSTRLITNYSKELIFQQNMPGYAEIINDQRSLLQRILDPFRAAIKRQGSMAD